MTPIVQLRKDPRVVNVSPEAQPHCITQIPSTHISPYVQKILGLKTDN
jgi:hypothetical protein